MNTSPNTITARGYVLEAYGDPDGDMNPTYDIVLSEPPDLAGVKILGTPNDDRRAVNAKVRPAPINAPVRVSWNNGDRFVTVEGEPIIFGSCSPGGAASQQEEMKKLEPIVSKGGSLSTADSGGPVSPGGPSSPPGGL